MKFSLLAVTMVTTFVFNPAGGEADSVESWMGAYLNQSKVGYSALFIGPSAGFPKQAQEFLTQHDHPPCDHALYSEAALGIRAYGKRREIAWRVAAKLFPDGSVQTFVFQMDSEGTSMRLSGEVKPEQVAATVHTAGTTQTLSIPLPKPGQVFLAETVSHQVAAAHSTGSAIPETVQVLEPHQMTVSLWKIEGLTPEKLETWNPPVDAIKISINAGGMKSFSWVSPAGDLIQEWASLAEDVGYLSVRETEVQARDKAYIHPSISSSNGVPDTSEPDLMYSTAVRVDQPIRDAQSIRRLTLELWDFSLPHPVPSGTWQKVLSDPAATEYTQESPLRLSIERATTPEAGQAASRIAPTPADLAPESLIQSDHPNIVEAANEITQGVDDPWAKARAILQWMRSNIETEYRITLPSALEVLQARKGDCNEQSTLFAALGRAAGIPTRVCTGLVYQRDGFYYHAWNEVWVGSEWIPIDSVMNQAPIDATHIKLGQGGLSDQTYIAGLIGRLRIKIVETETDDTDSTTHSPVRRSDRG